MVLRGAGINLEYYALQPYPRNEKVHFLYLGRIMQEKGMNELFAAARRLYAERQDFVLDLVGFFEEDYKMQVEQLQAGGIAAFHGLEPRPFYYAADCVVLPSYHEGMSNVLLEAAAMGRPLITSDIPGCREAVENGVTGLLVPVKDSESLYLAMKQMLSMRAEERRQMGLAGHDKMEREFNKKHVVEATIQALGLQADAGEVLSCG